MGFRGGVNLTPPPQHILVFKYPSRDRVKEPEHSLGTLDIQRCQVQLVPPCWIPLIHHLQLNRDELRFPTNLVKTENWNIFNYRQN